MKEVFADTFYWVAVVAPNDSWQRAARVAREGLGSVRLVTTEYVLVECLNMLAGRGPGVRLLAARFADALREDAGVVVVEQTHELFVAGLGRYRGRLDKGYSLTDCVSMVVMEQRRLTKILTNDHHFRQEGFTVLIPNASGD